MGNIEWRAFLGLDLSLAHDTLAWVYVCIDEASLWHGTSTIRACV